MKKVLSLLTLVTLFVLTANAADKYRRTWDFRNGWSATTVAKLEADESHWQVQSTGFQNVAMTVGTPQVYVDGTAEDITELSGMTVGGLKSAKHVQIVTTYATVKDVPCLWLNGKTSGTDYVEVTVPAGENVKFGYTGHGATGRGFKVTGGFADASGATTFTCTADNLNQINEVELINSNTADATLRLQTTGGGSHIYYIIIGEGDAPSSSKVGIVYSAQNGGKALNELAIYSALNGTENMTVEGINVDDANPTADQLKAYDAIILDNSLPLDNDLVAALKANIQWQPTLNLNAPLASALGYGALVTTESNNILIDNIKKSWFASLIKNEMAVETAEGSGKYTYTVNEGTIYGLNLADGAHKAETALASTVNQVDEEGTLVETGAFNYVHNLGYNEYAFYGTDGTSLSDASVSVVKAMVDELIGSKSDVKQCNKPSVTGIYKEMESKVVLTDIIKGATIYYTTDGTEPTEQSTVYAGDTLTFTQETTVKAIAIADGYTLSDVQSFDVKLYHQAKAPAVATVSKNGGDAYIYLSSEDGENVHIYYNFTGSNKISASSILPKDSAVVVKHSCTVTAFAVAAADSVALVQSETTTANVEANKSHEAYKQVAHFTGSGWNTVTNLALNGEPMTAWANTSNYFFSWGKTAQSSFTESTEPEVDGEGNPVMDDNDNPVYAKVYNNPDTTTCTTDTDWKCLSAGQVMLYQSNTLTSEVGDGSGYNPERAEDYDSEATSNDIQMGAKVSGDRYTARIESTKKYAAPFDVKVIAATTTGSAEKIAIQVSENGTDWTTIGDTCVCSAVKRLYKKFESSYDKGNDVYVRVAHIATGSGVSIHDIFVKQGEASVGIYGDVNGDTNVDINDVNAVINVICGGSEFKDAADVNGDGSVDINDVNAVIGVICGGAE